LNAGLAVSGTASSTWAPLRIGLFRTLWIAALVSNVGEWMQTVGAQWLLVHDSHAAILVSLVQTADALPAVLFALVAGVLADIFDRVKLLLAVLAGLTAAGGALTALTAADRMPPALLLMFTFVPGAGGILAEPAYQSLVPDLVPRPQVPAASALGSISINVARAIGPAIGGLLVARIGVAAVFGLNTATFVLSNVNAALQLFLPRWVRARGLSVYQMVLFGAQGTGAVIWGVVAGVAGLVPAFLISAVVMAAGAATLWSWPFRPIADMDRSMVRWPEAQPLISADRDSGPVLVRTAYTIAADKEQQFRQAMARLRQSRLRTGAVDWALYQDAQNPRLFIELYSVPSWEEHIRQHQERQTGTDLRYRDDAAALSNPQPQADHYLAVDVRG
jgi:Transmembrane secretion effector